MTEQLKIYARWSFGDRHGRQTKDSVITTGANVGLRLHLLGCPPLRDGRGGFFTLSSELNRRTATAGYKSLTCCRAGHRLSLVEHSTRNVTVAVPEFCPICDAPLNGWDYCQNCGHEIEV